MDNSQVRLLLRKKAVEAVHESTDMLKQAFALIKSGNRQKAEELRKAAREKRDNSVWMMLKANKLDDDS
jgi:ribosome maturation protein Sdo1